MSKNKDKRKAKSTFVPGYMDSDLSPELILDFFEKNSGRKPYTLHDLLTIFSAGRKRKRELEAALADLVSHGKLVRLKGPSFTLPQGLKNLRGHIKIQRQGMGFVRPQNGGEDIYVHPSQLNGAWDGDLVLVGILPGKSGKSREGRVLEVLERRVRELLVELLPESVKEDGIIKRLARPMDSRLSGYLLVDLEGLPQRPRRGEMLLVAPLKNSADADADSATGNTETSRPRAYPSDGVIRAKGIATFGSKESINMYERLVKAEHNISSEFPQPVLQEAAKLPADPNPSDALLPDLKNPEAPLRRDLRHIQFVTLDGADARDFDDAICVERLAQSAGGGYTLWVGIADVAYYVQPGSELDREAHRRGNSCYFPASVEPMLPEALSNGLCSLNPGVPRLAVVAEINFSSKGEPKKASFCRALIQSHARLTYEDTQLAFNRAAANQEIEDAKLAGLMPMLLEAKNLAEALVKRRTARGTLDFDLPEAKAEVDAKGKIVALTKRERLFTHRLIEEFMIAANEAVAEHLAKFSGQGLYFLYRAHPAPDAEKLSDLAKVLEQSGLNANLPERPGVGDLQKLLKSVQGSANEFVVNRLVLRSMMQAVYSPVPEGHFGLASEAYAHFTSPIRRYADLTVHRALLHSLGYGGKLPGLGPLTQIADDINNCEQEAVAAEREIYKICAALYLQDYIGEDFTGAVSGLSAFGLFVELASPPCEGFVPLESLPDDYYQLDHERQLLLGQRSGTRFTLGQNLNLQLIKADPLRQEITFALTGRSLASGRKPNGKNGLGKTQRKKNAKTKGNGNKSRETRGKKKRETLPKGSVRRRK